MKSFLPDPNTLISDSFIFQFICSVGKSYTITYWRIEVLNLDDDAPSTSYFDWFYFDWEENLNYWNLID